MRVAFYAPLKAPDHPVPSGDRRVARLLLKAIRQAGHDAVIASRMRAFEGIGDSRRQENIRRRGQSLARRFIRRHHDNPPDLWFTYHLYHKAPDWIGPVVADAFSIPYVIAEASVAPKQVSGRWATGHEAVCDAVRKAAHILTLNPDDAECLEPLLYQSGSLSALPPFIDTKPQRRAAAAREKHRADMAISLGISPSKTWVAVAAMMRAGDKLSSYRTLGLTMAQLRDLSLVWLVAGDGPEREAVVAALDSPDVIFLGGLENTGIDKLHAAADLAVWPAIREAFGMAMLEAQATGLPVVAGRSPGVAQIVEDGETGLLTPSGDDTMLALAVRRLVEAPDLRIEMGSAAMSKARQKHDIATATQHIDRIFRDAVKAAGA
jgi:glycosyltransferase involved in cell wall biosynthesis